MARRHGVLLVSLVLAAGCGSGAAQRAATPTAVAKAPAKKPKKLAKAGTTKKKSERRSAMTRAVGDYTVYRFTGEFTSEPITLTERVVAKKGEELLIDFALERKDGKQALRVHMDPATGAVSRVFRLGEDGPEPATVADYEALVAQTQLVPESNDEVVGTNESTCLVGEEAVDCLVTTYVVDVMGKEALLTISNSKDVPGRDIGGEIVGPDGAVLYSARLVDHGNQQPSDAVAHNDEE